ncbi:hypothetical protein HLRTI_001301 [Halorhabdus tiamatea SARL4B]|uniref:Uncharacterized protein n=1 Tax=Halorhabdus tiamatea SARL4B TaxID=1033806 RepID=U2F923_9EURY|nr:hypothetical protein HLRTI_001301 [Halorhabdus tiamatea SARL4B]
MEPAHTNDKDGVPQAPVHTSTRTPQTGSSSNALYINIPLTAHRTVGFTSDSMVHVSLHDDGEHVVWYGTRSIQQHSDGGSLYVNIPADAAELLGIGESTCLDVAGYRDRVEYTVPDKTYALVVHTDGENTRSV